MKYAIQVNAGPFYSQAAHTAYQFIKAALDKDHEIVRVFFYHDGVHNGVRHVLPAEDRHLIPAWSALAGDYGLDLVLCISAGQRRGLLPSDETAPTDRDAAVVADGFRVGGLGQWVEACLKADRVLVFGD
ncbi:sulfurtransferase complex subunit TusD [Methylocaldum sp.]|uniref:sulfurtransferase complex subunit TusD n=1 Tax=Methylocaldum sp. TaxID=1969727 RepID=UPI002D420AB9|nr:sulfurtransferase complex subunit TusD [Methylocaldum sp.]HYE36567.1 sulfurtransferase complex subunit TusD [Methylocaldum sp.]